MSAGLGFRIVIVEGTRPGLCDLMGAVLGLGFSVPEGSALAASLFLFHVGTNPGYALEREAVLFYEVGLEISAGDPSRVHLGFRSLSRGKPHGLPEDFKNVIAYDYFNHAEKTAWRGNIPDLIEIYDMWNYFLRSAASLPDNSCYIN